jgi:hypothetical protein
MIMSLKFSTEMLLVIGMEQCLQNSASAGFSALQFGHVCFSTRTGAATAAAAATFVFVPAAYAAALLSRSPHREQKLLFFVFVYPHLVQNMKL